jgi:2-polyprenyl-3-methyl-5-hydroxy-6-metoxy-1,4-benzoquinol methylase
VKLPSRLELTSEEMLLLYRNDSEELFGKSMHWRKYSYLQRFNEVIANVRNNVAKGGIIADLGCAQGNYAITLASNGYETVAVDLRPAFLRYAKFKVDKESDDVFFVAADILRLPFRKEAFDCVVGGEVIEHLLDPEEALNSIRTTIKRGGHLVITTVNRERLSSKAQSFREFKEMRAKGVRINHNTFLGTEHVFELTHRELVELIESAGFKVESLHTKGFLGMYFLLPFFGNLPYHFLTELGQFLLRIPFFSRKLAMDMIAYCSKSTLTG